MLFTTKGIVLHNFKYGESGIIIKIYTELFGLKSYIVKGIKSKKSQLKISLFQPLSLLELVVYNKNNCNIQNIKEAKFNYTFKEIPFNIEKTSIAFFVSEVLCKTIREEEKNPGLFNFLFNSVELLDKSERATDFHLVFLIELSKHLGFCPQNNFSETNKFFNLNEGVFTGNFSGSSLFAENSENMNKILGMNFNNINEKKFTLNQRRELLKDLIKFYQFHIEGLKEIKSLSVLESIFQ